MFTLRILRQSGAAAARARVTGPSVAVAASWTVHNRNLDQRSLRTTSIVLADDSGRDQTNTDKDNHALQGRPGGLPDFIHSWGPDMFKKVGAGLAVSLFLSGVFFLIFHSFYLFYFHFFF